MTKTASPGLGGERDRPDHERAQGAGLGGLGDLQRVGGVQRRGGPVAEGLHPRAPGGDVGAALPSAPRQTARRFGRGTKRSCRRRRPSASGPDPRASLRRSPQVAYSATRPAPAIAPSSARPRPSWPWDRRDGPKAVRDPSGKASGTWSPRAPNTIGTVVWKNKSVGPPVERPHQALHEPTGIRAGRWAGAARSPPASPGCRNRRPRRSAKPGVRR